MAPSKCLLIVSGLVLSAGPVLGQTWERRGGFWFGLGIAGASARATCAPCDTTRNLGIAGYVNLGGSLSRQVLVGIEGTGWRQSESNTRREYGAVTGVVVLFPIQGRPFYLKAGIGAGRYAEETGPDVFSSNGFAGQLGAGADFRVTRRITVAPFVQYLVSNDQDVTRNRLILITPLDFNLIQLGVSARWH